jgi:hypothetical protein
VIDGAAEALGPRRFADLRRLLRVHAEAFTPSSSALPMASEDAAWGSIDAAQWMGAAGCPARLATISTPNMERLAEALARDGFEVAPKALRSWLASWLALEARYGPTADVLDAVIAARAGACEASVADARLGTARHLMVEGNTRLSRTLAYAHPHTRALDLDAPEHRRQEARDGLAKAVDFVLARAPTAVPRRDDVIALNALVVGDLAGDPGGRLVHDGAEALFRWLDAQGLEPPDATAALAIAERVHHDIAAADAFVDGNGRTARLVADWVLLRAGRAPAFPRSMAAYFARGSARAPVSRDDKRRAFVRTAARGEAVLRRVTAASAR